MTSPIHLSIPAEPAYARTVRMMAANLAVLSGMSIEAVEDVRMAAEEGFVWCCATKPASAEIDFTVDGGVAMEVAFGSAEPSEDDTTTAYADLLLSAVCDEYQYSQERNVLYLKKSVSPTNA